MAFKVIVSPQAWDEFFQIYEYIGAESRDAAARFCDALLNHIELPATFPHSGVARTWWSGSPNIEDVYVAVNRS